MLLNEKNQQVDTSILSIPLSLLMRKESGEGMNDMLHTEMLNQSMYSKYMMEIQKPELRQMLIQMRDGKMQQITQLQQEIKNMMPGQ